MEWTRRTSGNTGHPSDAGMAAIANTIYKAMGAHAVPEPSSVVLLFTALTAILGVRMEEAEIAEGRAQPGRGPKTALETFL